jgi:signal transduction histidine kinase
VSENSFTYKRGLIFAALAVLAAVAALIVARTALLPWLVDTFILLPSNSLSPPTTKSFVTQTLALSAVAFATTVFVNRVGLRRSFPFVGLSLFGLTLAQLLSANLWSSILFLPMALAILFALAGTQALRLAQLNAKLTDRLLESSSKLNSLHLEETSSRLNSSMKLLDTMLSPQEIIVFQCDSNGELVTAARHRSLGVSSLDSSRISAWREGISLCEQSLKTRSLLTQKIGNENSGTSVAVPLHHEKQSVGAVLLRLETELDDDDRKFLMAVGAQLARNLQRQNASKSVSGIFQPGYLSARAYQRRLDLLGVINGLLQESQFGINVLEQIRDGIAIAYLDGTIAYVNKPLLNLAGVTEFETRELTLFDLLDKLRTDVFDDPKIAVRRVLQSGEAYEGELQLSEPAGTFGLRISLVLDEIRQGAKTPQPLCLAITVSDLTRSKAYEELKSDMISLMSHELRTPLTSIKGFAELHTTEPDLPEQAKEFVGIIANESQRLSRMINSFLAVAQLERKDRQDVLKIPLRLDDVVRETVASLQPSAKKKRIRLVEQPTQRLPPVAADKSLISQAVKNLVSNAIKYSPERTTVTISTALEAEAVRVIVQDRGYGIPAEARDRVWEKFFRVVREGQEKDEESTGLGLSFVREVVEQHGGAVALETEEGGGSKFSFTLPRL